MRADFAYTNIFFQDELRAGTRTELGRKWSPVGHRPISPVKIGYQSVYLYLALCPFSGQGFAAFLPKLNGEWFAWFVAQIKGCVDRPTLLIADGATAHQGSCFANTQLVFSKLPPGCPELNPVERVVKEVRRRLKHRVFGCLEEAQKRLESILVELFTGSNPIVNLACFP